MNLASPSTRASRHAALAISGRVRSTWRSSSPHSPLPQSATSTSVGPPLDDIELQKRTPPDGGGDSGGGGGGGGGGGSSGGSGPEMSLGEQRSNLDAGSSARSSLPLKAWNVFKMQMRYLGPGITMSVAYCDPGNWATDLRAGSQFGYPLLFIILLTGIFGIILQVLALRMGIVCNKDLAVLTREWVLSIGRDEKALGVRAGSAAPGQTVATEGLTVAVSSSRKSIWAQRGRVALLWLLYLVAEGAIICTELAELVGSAIALNLLFPRLPLWGGVLITSVDVFLILLIYKPDTRSLRIFEFFVAVLVMIVISCLVALVVRVDPHWPDVFQGYLPSATVVQPQPLYVAIGILGATVMPHGLFLGSHFACFERENPTEKKGARDASFEEEDNEEDLDSSEVGEQTAARRQHDALHPSTLGRLYRLRVGVAKAFSGGDDSSTEALWTSPPARPLPTIKRRIMHASIDVAVSMILFAITTNSALLIIAAQAFFFGIDGSNGDRGGLIVGDLFQAFELIRERLSQAFAILFAVALLASGQSASITVTLAGQVISEGMINWRTNPFLRRCLTRGITLIPAFAVAAGIGREGLDDLLVASQVALSMALPFVLLPLLAITASKGWMSAEVLPSDTDAESQGVDSHAPDQPIPAASTTPSPAQDRSDSQHPGSLAAVRVQPSLLLRWSWWTRGAGKVSQLSAQSQRRSRRGTLTLADEERGREAPATSTVRKMEGGSAMAHHTPVLSHLLATAPPALLSSMPFTQGLPSMPVPTTALWTHFANNWILVLITGAIYIIIVISDVYVIVTTAIGTGGG